jgi:hypothetical protein
MNADRVDPDTVRAFLAQIRQAAEDGDNESAHIAEDTLWGVVLLAIAEDVCEQPSACAALALSSRNIDYDRWYA